MPIPDCPTLMLPLLETMQDRAEHTMRETVENPAGKLNLAQEEQTELLPSYQQAVSPIGQRGRAST